MAIPRPDVPDTVIRFKGQPLPRIIPSASDTVALTVIHDWGPLGGDAPGPLGIDGGPQLLLSFDEWVTRFGDSDTPGRTAVAGAFAGEGLPGTSGAGAVIVYRMATSAAAAATVTLNDRQGTPAAGLTLTAKYKGVRGNRVSVIVDVDPANIARDRLSVLYSGAGAEKYVYDPTDVVGLTASINRRSKYVNAANVEATPQRLAATSGTALTGGNDGSTLTGVEHLAALGKLQNSPFFGVIAAFDLTDPAIRASYVSWARAREDANQPVRLVIGGAAAEVLDDAMTRTAGIDYDHVLNFGVGTYHDDLLDKDLSMSQLAPRFAGILASRGQRHSITGAKIGGLHAIGDTAPDDEDVVAAVNGGVCVLRPANSAVADLKIAKGVTTFTDQNVPDKPPDIFSDARLIGIMDNYVRNMTAWGDDIAIGELPVNDDTRDQVYNQARKLEDELLAQGLILPGDDVTIPKPWVNVINTDTDPVLNDTIPYQFGWQFAKTTNAIMGEGTVQ